MMDAKYACLNCTLPICDETLPECAFVQIRRASSGDAKVSRAAQQRVYYAKNREKEIERTRKWQAANRDRVREIKREYSRRSRGFYGNRKAIMAAVKEMRG